MPDVEKCLRDQPARNTSGWCKDADKDAVHMQLVPDDVFYLNSMCEGLETPPVPAPSIAPAQAPSVLPIPLAGGYGSYGQGPTYGGVAAAAPAPSAEFGSELAPETAPMGRGAPTKPLPKVLFISLNLSLRGLLEFGPADLMQAALFMRLHLCLIVTFVSRKCWSIRRIAMAQHDTDLSRPAHEGCVSLPSVLMLSVKNFV